MTNQIPRAITVIFFLFLVENSHCANMKISPNNPTETLDTSVHFSCTPGKDVDHYSEIYVIDIIKNNKDQIAVLKKTGISFKYDKVQKRFEGVGELNGDVTKAYLNLTLLMPRVEDAGYYTCVISYMNNDGLLKQDESSARLVVKKMDKTNTKYLETVVNSLVRRVEDLEAVKKEKDMKVDHLLTKLNALEKKLNFQSMFSATFKEKTKTLLSSKKVIIFDDILQQKGKGYDKSTGVYTAPKSGMYSFSLAIGTWSPTNKLTDVELTVNGRTLTTLQTTNYNQSKEGYQDQAGISLVTLLRAGDKVKAVTSGTTTNQEYLIGLLSLFSGYLVKE